MFRPDPTIGDGTYSNNGWLQELPKPQSKMTWDNVVLVSSKAAADMKISKGDVLRVTVGNGSIEGPAWILPGHADDSVTITCGYGREASGRVGNKIGYNAYSIQDPDFTLCGGRLNCENRENVPAGQYSGNTNHGRARAGPRDRSG